MADMFVGTWATWYSEFMLTKSGESIAIIRSLEEANMKTVGTYKTTIPYLKSVHGDFVKLLKKLTTIAINYSQSSSLANGLSFGVYLEFVDILKDSPNVDHYPLYILVKNTTDSI